MDLFWQLVKIQHEKKHKDLQKDKTFSIVIILNKI
jgi:hypothetical protein